MKDSNCVYVNIIEKLYLMSSREGEKKEEKRLSPSCWFVSKEKKKKKRRKDGQQMFMLVLSMTISIGQNVSIKTVHAY